MSLKKLYVNICSPLSHDYVTSEEEPFDGNDNSNDPLLVEPRHNASKSQGLAATNKPGRPRNSFTSKPYCQPQSIVAASLRIERENRLKASTVLDAIKQTNVRAQPEESIVPKISISYTHSEKSEQPDSPFEFPENCDYEERDKIDDIELDPSTINVELKCGPSECKDESTNNKLLIIKKCFPSHDKNFVCDKCGFRVNNASKFRKHYYIHSGELPFACTYKGCDYRGRHNNSLDYHMKKVHVTGKPFKCKIQGCDYATKHAPGLRIHNIKKHSGEKAVACELCSYRCYLRGELRKHMVTHSPMTPFACDYPGCRYACKLSSNLRKHRRSHTEERPYACELCPFRSNFVSSLKTHKRIHTDERPYCCHGCGHRCNSVSNLKKHILKKHKVVPKTKEMNDVARNDNRLTSLS